MLAVMNRLIWADSGTRDRSGWAGRTNMDFLELEGRSVGIVGFGYIGSELARKLREGFRCRVLGYDPHVNPRLPLLAGVETVETLDDLLKQVSVLCLCAELTDETRQLVSTRELALLPQRSVVINTARGQILDLDALSAALESGHVFGAGIDVTSPEPLPEDHPLFRQENVVMTPHVAGLTVETAEAQTRFSVKQVMTVLGGGEPTFPVNPEAWEGEASRRPS
jgi:D-3-phosphoglycerate dehydrogenase / 2-oxoglutarate reductase